MCGESFKNKNTGCSAIGVISRNGISIPIVYV